MTVPYRTGATLLVQMTQVTDEVVDNILKVICQASFPVVLTFFTYGGKHWHAGFLWSGQSSLYKHSTVVNCIRRFSIKILTRLRKIHIEFGCTPMPAKLTTPRSVVYSPFCWVLICPAIGQVFAIYRAGTGIAAYRVMFAIIWQLIKHIFGLGRPDRAFLLSYLSYYYWVWK